MSTKSEYYQWNKINSLIVVGMFCINKYAAEIIEFLCVIIDNQKL